MKLAMGMRIHNFRKIGLTAIACGLLALAGCKPEIKEPSISYNSYKVKKISAEAIDVVFLFDVDNPNSMAFENIDLDYVLSVDGIEAFTGQNSGLTARANDITQWELPATFTYTQVFNTWANLAKKILSGEKSVPFELKTTVKAKVLMVNFNKPITTSGEFPLPTLNANALQTLLENQ